MSQQATTTHHTRQDQHLPGSFVAFSRTVVTVGSTNDTSLKLYRNNLLMSSHPAAAVAIIRVATPEDSVLLLRRRHCPDDPWSGHFSFPGGKKEEQDGTLFETCRRETFEETGIRLSTDAMQKKLPASFAGSRVNSPILVQPYVFRLAKRPPLQLEAAEIQSYCWLATSTFRNSELHIEAEVLPNRYFPAFPLQDYYLWGFTYGLLKNLLATD